MTITALPTAPSRADPSTFSARADALLGALDQFVTEANALAVSLNLDSTTSTSVTSLAIGTGSKSLTVETAKSYQPGMSLQIAHDSTNYMHGEVTSYNSGTGALVVNVTHIKGSGTEASWTVTLSAPMTTLDVVNDTTPQLGGDLDLNAFQITNHRDDHWTKTTGTFTATPASTSTITMTEDLTASILVGMSLKYVIGGVTKYGRVGAITANLLTVNGAPLSGDVTALYYGGGTIRQVVVMIPDLYEDASDTALIVNHLRSSLFWALPKSYCVHFKVYSNVHDTGTHGQASVRINATELCTTAGGLTIAAATTWYSTVVDIDVAAYDINPGEAIEVTSIKAGNGDASDLTVVMIFVTP